MKQKWFVLFLLVLPSFAFAQSKSVTGTVIETNGEPLTGVSIVEKGTTNGTISDLDGRFTLTLQQSPSVLEFSMVGMQSQEKNAKDGDIINVTLSSDDIMLEQIVVTGYTSQRRADLTGAVSVVDVDDMMKSADNNPMKALQGRVPGMQIVANGNPGGKVGIKIRGISNLNDESAPLYIIDGVPTQSGMHELNSNDIESIQVLKDASSASIYGARAANGVIVITTKQGKEGKTKVSFDASLTTSYYNKRVDMLNAREYGEAMFEAMTNVGMNPNSNSVGYLYDWQYDANGNAVLNGQKISKYIDKDRLMPASDTDWFDEISRTGIAQNYNLSVSSGTEKHHSLYSLNYYDNQGVLKDTYFRRFSARINNSYKLLGDLITIGENFSVNRTREVEANTDDVLNLALQAHPLIPVYKTDGNWGGPSAGMNDRHNPVRVLNANKDNPYDYWRLFGNAYVNIQPVKDLNVKSSFGIDFGNFYKRILTRNFTSGEIWLNEKEKNDLSAVELQQRHWMKWTWSNTATYNFEFGKNRMDALVGIEMNKQNDIEFESRKKGFVIETPEYMWPNAGTGEAFSSGGSTAYSLLSYFGKINYAYDNRYLASVTVRRDGSSRFGKNNRYGTFPSFNVGWRISEESFLENSRNAISDLKLRFGWGQTGNQNTISNAATYSLYITDYSGGSNDAGGNDGTAYDFYGKGTGILTSGFRKIQSGNDDLKWETSTQTNIGLDFAFLKHSLYGSFDFYIKKTEDLLAMVYYPAASGEGSAHWANGASMENKGFELLIGYRGKTSFGLTYDITGNISTNRNKITKLPESLINTYGGNGIDNILGHSIHSTYGYVADGLFKTQEEVDNHADQTGKGLGRIRYKDLNNDGVINELDQKWIGSSEPDFEYGFNVNLAYKGFDLSLFFQGVQGGEVLNNVKKYTDFWAVENTGSNKGDRLLNAWSPSNPNSSIPALAYTNDNNEDRVSTYYLESQSFLKLRNVQLGYTLPSNVSEKIKMEKIRFYLSGQNLFTIKSKDFTGVDPENPGWGYPIPITFTFGLNVNF